ncbi:hypothetical protein K461DRAFT_290118 [Myriangium duriaei CBS 260.36]|uniref:JmjC domain-containing histone demethylation protein 1 n=1 Tax=Myriangium duriaei CBS 260.36 TaxID=1168546 RepID=A0A9P4MQ22_9PEZI|nr:hypothetical protein K461DRAFT_290118 [Myriangium duriaei CBS 260.36]
MAAHLYGTPFKLVKTNHEQFSRPKSPDQPLTEPLSPILNPADTPFSRFVKGFQHSNGLSRPMNNSSWTSQRAWDTQVYQGSRPVIEHRRKSSNTIEELAQVALAAGPSPPLQARRLSYSSVSSSAQPQHSHQQSWGSPPALPTSSHRSQKRSWSAAEVFHPGTFPQARMRNSMPATIHNKDPDVTKISGQNELEAAALLLNFAGQQSESSTTKTTSSQLFNIQDQHGNQQHTVQRSSQDSAILSYLPSPQPNPEEFKPPQETLEPDLEPTDEAMLEDLNQQNIPEHQSYIQTPPEDETQGTLSHQDRDDDSEAIEEKPKRPRGWPKGKPRGPKKSASGASTTKSKNSATKRSRRSAVASKSPEAVTLQPRRNSHMGLPSPTNSLEAPVLKRSRSVPSNCRFVLGKQKSNAGRRPLPKLSKETVCETCKTARESLTGEMDQWISCNGCKKWFHSDCAGFQSEREVRDVDKFFCKVCEADHGATTFVRKSTRAHTAVDYAGLNQGVLRTSDDCHEHHYIQPIKDGTFTFDPETFPRMPPELVTAEYFERSACFNQPILIPAHMNPKPEKRQRQAAVAAANTADGATVGDNDQVMLDDFEYDIVHDDGQDKLDMVIPQDLTVRHVCNLVGADYPLEVIDVKVQGTEGGRWNLGKFADYYETEGEKPIRNVISLEVADTKLGRLLRRPKVVRQIDLQDNVWPKDDPAKSVAFYCLMSVADSYTDFHIDFGGSSVYYHILKGSKTFFFIPPKAKHLKAYEDWNNSPEQNFTFLPHTTKECYRVDLFEGDTMLIPSGWIHAVWTPSNSLVIGGNFLTHMHYGTQLRVVDVERANKTPLKFRYPKFQKVMWYAVIKYLRDDPLPDDVRLQFYSGQQFHRDIPAWQQFDEFGDVTERDPGSYHARYYSQMELDGLPDLASYIFRTIMISLDRIEGITVETRRAVVASIPKGYGEPLDIAKTFALWVAWKRGNENPPQWAHPEFGLPDKEGVELKKLSSKMLKQKQRQEAFEAYKIAPERQSARQKQQESNRVATFNAQQPESPSAATPSPKTSLGPRRVACDACRRRRIRCKHKEEVASSTTLNSKLVVAGPSTYSTGRRPSREFDAVLIPRSPDHIKKTQIGKTSTAATFANAPPSTPGAIMRDLGSMISAVTSHMITPGTASMDTPSLNTPADASAKKGRSKACPDCRKSKRRCIHDEDGKIDPFKEKQAPIPRGSTTKKRKHAGDDSPETKRPKHEQQDKSQTIADHIPASGTLDAGVGNLNVQPLQTQSLPYEPMAIDPQLTAMSNMANSASTNNDAIDSGMPTSFGQFAAQALNYSIATALDSIESTEVSREGPTRSDMVEDITTTLSAPLQTSDSGVEGMISDGGLIEPAQNQTARIEVDPTTAVDPAIITAFDDSSSRTHPVVGIAAAEQAEHVIPKLEPEPPPALDRTIPNNDSVDEHEITETIEGPTADGSGLSPGVGSTEFTQPVSETKEQTPSANEPPSLSSVSSPLSTAQNTPEPVTTPVLPAAEPSARQSSRRAKPISRFANSHFEGSKLSAAAVEAAKSATRKRSSSSLTAELPGSVDTSPTSKRVKASAPPRDKQLSKTPQAVGQDIKIEGAQTAEDEESLRLARELMGESFGLRGRRSVGV